jgi:hypothetical protein
VRLRVERGNDLGWMDVDGKATKQDMEKALCSQVSLETFLPCLSVANLPRSLLQPEHP